MTVGSSERLVDNVGLCIGEDAPDRHMGNRPANFGRGRPEGQALAPQFSNFPYDPLLLEYSDQRAVLPDFPPERRSTAKKASALLLVGFGP
jgi:hypothetical protein